MRHALLAGTAFVLLQGTPTFAAETVTYKYDALGRLKQVTKTGGPATGQQTTTTYDPAGNRTNQTTTGAPPPPP
jgi:YD repeat-containing protein